MRVDRMMLSCTGCFTLRRVIHARRNFFQWDKMYLPLIGSLSSVAASGCYHAAQERLLPTGNGKRVGRSSYYFVGLLQPTCCRAIKLHDVSFFEVQKRETRISRVEIRSSSLSMRSLRPSMRATPSPCSAHDADIAFGRRCFVAFNFVSISSSRLLMILG